MKKLLKIVLALMVLLPYMMAPIGLVNAIPERVVATEQQEQVLAYEIRHLTIGCVEGVIDHGARTITFTVHEDKIDSFNQFRGPITELEADSNTLIFFAGGQEWPLGIGDEAGISTGNLVYVAGGIAYMIIIAHPQVHEGNITRLSIGGISGRINQEVRTITFSVNENKIDGFNQFRGPITELEATSNTLIFFAGGQEWPLGIGDEAGINVNNIDTVSVPGGSYYHLIIEEDPVTRHTGSITITRVVGEVYPGPTMPGVPIRVQQVIFVCGVTPTTTQLQNPTWMAANAMFIGDPITRITGLNGGALFDELPLGNWLVQELATYEVVTNPIAPDDFFDDFVIAIPSWEDEEPVYDIRAYPTSRFAAGVEDKYLVGTQGNIATWQISHNIMPHVGTLDYFFTRDTHSANLQFIPSSVVGRFTPRTTTDNSWDAGIELVAGVDFTVTYNLTTRRVDIDLTAVGIARLAAEGLLGTGNVMFRLQSEIVAAGIGRNIAQWYHGTGHDPRDPSCPPGHPDYPNCEPLCPIGDPTCSDPYDFCLIYPDHEDCRDIIGDEVRAFFLEVLKKNVANQGLAGAVFDLYRELTAYETANLSDADFTVAGGQIIPAAPAAPARPETRVLPVLDVDGEHVTGTTNANGTTDFDRIPLTTEGQPHTDAENPALWLFEREAPAGYRAIDPWMGIQVTRAHTRILEEGPPVVQDFYWVDVIVYNDPSDGWTLPETGGRFCRTLSVPTRNPLAVFYPTTVSTRMENLRNLISIATPVSASVRNPQVFGPVEGPDYGSITVTRVVGESCPSLGMPGIPHQVRQVTFANGVIPNWSQLQDSMWMAENATFIGEPIVVVTDRNGVSSFDELPLGFWLVQELASYGAVTNPNHPEGFFNDFLIGIPRWVSEFDNGGEIGGEWVYDVSVYPASRVAPNVEEKHLVGTQGNVATWQVSHSIMPHIGALDHFFIRDTHSEQLRFIPGSVEGRFTPRTTTDTRWDAGVALMPNRDFTVTYNLTTRRVDIDLTRTGIARLASEGLLGTGNIMFRLQSEAVVAGVGRNVAQWYHGRGYDPRDPNCPNCDSVCSINTLTCEDSYDFCLIYPDHEDCQDIPGDFVRTFYLELLKRSTETGNRRLAGAVFHMYRELTAYEAANLTDAAFTALGGRDATGNVRVIPLLDAEDRHVSGTTNASGITNFGRTPLTSEGMLHTTAENPRLWLFEYEEPTGYRTITPWVPVHVTRGYLRPNSDVYVDIVVYNEPIPLSRVPIPPRPNLP